MGTVAFDYSALADARKYAKNVATGSLGMEDYSAGIARSLHNPIQDGWLAAYEPYGHSYTGSARTCIKNKQNDLADKQQIWLDLSNNLDQFLEYLKETDKAAADCFKTIVTANYASSSGIWEYFQAGQDVLYNFLAVDLANCNGLTRAIADFGKSIDDELILWSMRAEDYLKHGNGRYVLNIVGSSALLLVSVAGVVISFVTLPFTGGSSCAPMVACVSVVGLAASSISTAISAWNTKVTVEENAVALSIDDDPAMSRFYGDITKYSEYVAKTDFGSKEANEAAASFGQALDTTQAIADVTSLGCGAAMTLGSKTVKVGGDVAKGATYTSFDFSKANVKANTLKVFGLDVAKTSADSVVEVGTINKTSLGTFDEVRDTSVKLSGEVGKVKTTAISIEKTAGVVDESGSLVKSINISKTSATSAYTKLVASDGYATQEMLNYAMRAESSTTAIDYTKSLAFTGKVALDNVADAPKIGTYATYVKSGAQLVYDGTTLLQSEDDVRTKLIITEAARQNYLLNQVNEYIVGYDAKEDKVTLFGNTGSTLCDSYEALK